MSSTTSRGVALVTGSSTGIGYATALRLARDGFHVVATMRSPESCDLFEVGVNEKLKLEVQKLDVTNDKSIDAVFADVTSRLGAIEVLVANAGIGGRTTVLESTTIDDFREIFETNLYGVVRCIYKVLPAMRERRSGSIVAISSQAGRFVDPVQSVYNASKYALEAVMEGLAMSLARLGVRVAIIEPGVINTPIFTKGAREHDLPDYQVMRDIFMQFIIKEISQASDPAGVAECISNAITTDKPMLRYLVGHGAERNIRIRESMTDEQWLDLYKKTPDEIMAARVPENEETNK